MPPSVSASDVRVLAATFITKQPGSGSSEPPGCPGGAAASAREMHRVPRDASVTGSWAALTSRAGGKMTLFSYCPDLVLKFEVLRRGLLDGWEFDKAGEI